MFNLHPYTAERDGLRARLDTLESSNDKARLLEAMRNLATEKDRADRAEARCEELESKLAASRAVGMCNRL